MYISRIALLLAFVACAAFGQSRVVSPNDIAAVTEKICLAQEARVRLDSPRGVPGAEAIYKSLDYPGYCACIAKGIRQEATPGFAASATDEQVDKFMAKIGDSCMERSVKHAMSKAVCPGLAQSVAAAQGKIPKESDLNIGCPCIERVLAPLSASQLQAEFSTVNRNMNELREHGKFLTKPSSIFVEMKACFAEASGSER